MIRVLGSPHRVCDGVTRRELLRVGGLSLFGLSLPELLRAEATAATLPPIPGPGRAKSVILLYLFGGPAIHETWDPKPDAPREIRGEFGSIPTSVPGVHFCEFLPKSARWMNRSTLVRSATHNSNDHSAGLLHTLTGLPPDKLESLVPILPTQAPGLMSVVEYLTRKERRSIPASVWMPCYPGWGQQILRPGPFGGYLGRRYDPLFTHCEITERYEPRDFYDTRSHPIGRLTVPSVQLPPELTLDRLQQRQSLATQLQRETTRLGESPDYERFDEYQRKAFDILTANSGAGSESPWRAFQLDEESPALRDRYGRHLYGEAALTARRLVERGVRFATVSWESFEKAGADPAAWDTHEKHFSILKDYRLPLLDQVYSTLCEDLEARGLLDETLVVVMGEMGRAPKVNAAGGRDHWSYLYNVLFTGAGLKKGCVYGSSDSKGYRPATHPVTPGDIIATIYAAMGIDPGAIIEDAAQRPRPIVPEGSPIRAILA
ncbi:MAG: DUF1501 domain-containing protein [Pedosphaera sp.]|nr:DUF1501 domain-containing protein [Pedosphaera sp.]